MRSKYWKSEYGRIEDAQLWNVRLADVLECFRTSEGIGGQTKQAPRQGKENVVAARVNLASCTSLIVYINKGSLMKHVKLQKNIKAILSLHWKKINVYETKMISYNSWKGFFQCLLNKKKIDIKNTK